MVKQDVYFVVPIYFLAFLKISSGPIGKRNNSLGLFEGLNKLQFVGFSFCSVFDLFLHRASSTMFALCICAYLDINTK